MGTRQISVSAAAPSRFRLMGRSFTQDSPPPAGHTPEPSPRGIDNGPQGGGRYIQELTMRVCSTPGCPVIHRGRGRCPGCQAKADARRRPDGNPYATRGHRLGFRGPVLARHPYCQCLGECGHHEGLCAKRSTVADHHPTERVDLIAQGLDPNDPQYGRGVCAPCHDAKTARTKPSGWNARD